MLKRSLFAITALSPLVVFGVDVMTDGGLQAAIIAANAGGDPTINFTSNITLGGGLGANLMLRPINSDPDFTPSNRTIVINGNGFTLDGANTFRGFFMNESTGTVTVNNLIFNNTRGQGGSAAAVGAITGGGGGGFGGAIFVDSGATVELVSPTFTNSTAIGGAGGSHGTQRGGGGGGGFTGGCTTLLSNTSAFAGSGGGGFNANSGAVGALFGGTGGGGALASASTATEDGSAGGNNFAGADGGSGGLPGGPAQGGNASAPGAGGGAGAYTTLQFANGGNGSRGGGGGGGGGFVLPVTSSQNGGNGQDFAGGGGGGGGQSTPDEFSSGGTGSFAGGGGNAGSYPGGVGNGGNGGFGGGGGGGGILSLDSNMPGVGGFGGGNGIASDTAVISGGGAGFGGALFLRGDSTGAGVGAQVTLSGTIAFSGNTALGGIGGGGSNGGVGNGADIFMMSSSALTIDIDTDLTMTSAIAGDLGAGSGSQTAGGLTKMGTGTLSLIGSNEYTGTTTVSAGELNVNGSLASEVIVNNGATLSGNLSVRRVGTNPTSGDLTSSGTIAPGNNGTGAINLEGNLVLNADATFIADVQPNGVSDRVSLVNSNTADLGNSTLNIFVNSGNYIAGTTFEIINAPTGGTEFGTIIQSGPLAGQVEFEIEYSSVILRVLGSVIFEDQDILPGVDAVVADCFRQADIVPGSDFAMITEILGTLSNADVNAALEQLAPTAFGALEWINARNNSYVADILSQHTNELCCSPRDCCSCDCNASAWITVFGNIADNTEKLDNLRPFDANTIGVLGGVDFCCSNDFYWGGAIGYNRTHLIWTNRGGSGNLNTYYGALYGSWKWNCFSVDGSVLGGASDQDLERRIVFSTIDRTATSDPWGYFVTGHLGLKQQLQWCWGFSEMFALADYHYYTRESFEERGADSLNLDVGSHDQHFIRAEAGVRVIGNIVSKCSCAAPYIGLSIVNDYPINDSEQRATFSGQSCRLDVDSYESSECMASPQIGGKWTSTNGCSFLLGYKGLFNRSVHINQVEGRFEFLF